MKREELLRNEGYWTSKIQIDLYHQVEQYLKDNKLNRTQFAEKLGVTKGYLSQVLNGNFDHKLSKLVNLSLAIGKVPNVEFLDVNELIKQDKTPYISVYYQGVFQKEELIKHSGSFSVTERKDIMVNSMENINLPLETMGS